jgi:hypothetical protein
MRIQVHREKSIQRQRLDLHFHKPSNVWSHLTRRGKRRTCEFHLDFNKIWDCGLQKSEATDFCSMPPRLWRFVKAVILVRVLLKNRTNRMYT